MKGRKYGQEYSNILVSKNAGRELYHHDRGEAGGLPCRRAAMRASRKLPGGAGSNSAHELLAQRLCEWRKSRDFALKEVAGEFGVSESTWSRWEKGTRFPLPENIRRLAEFIGVPMCSFFYPDEQTCPACPLPDDNRKKP
jgi:DNA-binding XRE family transcriptional regulator